MHPRLQAWYDEQTDNHPDKKRQIILQEDIFSMSDDTVVYRQGTVLNLEDDDGPEYDYVFASTLDESDVFTLDRGTFLYVD